MIYRRFKKYKIDEVLIHVIFDEDIKDIKHASPEWFEKIEKDFDGHLVKMNSQRYQTFAKKGIKCVHCGLEGKFFALEQNSSGTNNPDRWHFNLYGIDEKGQEVMITKDHIIPRSKGGINHISNYQPLCSICNGLKGNNREE